MLTKIWTHIADVTFGRLDAHMLTGQKKLESLIKELCTKVYDKHTYYNSLYGSAGVSAGLFRAA